MIVYTRDRWQLVVEDLEETVRRLRALIQRMESRSIDALPCKYAAMERKSRDWLHKMMGDAESRLREAIVAAALRSG